MCYNPDIKYAIIKDPGGPKSYIIASDVIDNLSKLLQINFEIVEAIPGEVLSKVKYVHPIFKDRDLKFLPSSHTTSTKGTGLVHTAPAHGPDDFLVALQNKISIVITNS